MEAKFFCPKCGQHLEAPPDMGGQWISCPQCKNLIRIPGGPAPVPGVPPPPPPPAYAYSTAPQTSGLAVASLISGIFSITLGWLCCILFALPPIITGHMALARIRKEPERLQGRGMALAGLIMGYVALCIYGILMLIYIGIMVVAASES